MHLSVKISELDLKGRSPLRRRFGFAAFWVCKSLMSFKFRVLPLCKFYRFSGFFECELVEFNALKFYRFACTGCML